MQKPVHFPHVSLLHISKAAPAARSVLLVCSVVKYKCIWGSELVSDLSPSLLCLCDDFGLTNAGFACD